MPERSKLRARVKEFIEKLGPIDILPPSPMIAQQLEIDRVGDVINVIGDLRRKGYLSYPTPEQTRHRRSLAVLYVTGEKWTDIKPYAQLFMGPSEVQYALHFEKGRDLPKQTINNAMSRRRKEGVEVEPLTAEERRDIKKRNNRFTPKDELEGRMQLWLNARDFVQDQAVASTSFRRGHWMAMIDLSQKPLILADPHNEHQVQVESYSRDWLECRMRRLSGQSELPFSEGQARDRHPAQAGLFDSRAQIVERFLTQTVGLKLPVEDDSLVPASTLLAPGLGMKVRTISEAMSYLRRSGVLPPTNPENTRRKISTSISFLRGNKWLEIQRYASFMYPREVLFVLIEQLGEEEVKRRGLERGNIARIITNHGLTKYKRGQLKDLTPEQRKDTLKFTHEPDENRKGRVKFWLEVMDLLDKQDIEHPSRRAVWMDMWQKAASAEEGLRMVVHLWEERQKFYFVVNQILVQANTQKNREVLTLQPMYPNVKDIRQLELPIAEPSGVQISPLQLVLPEDPLTTKGSKVKLKGGQVGLVEGEFIENGISYIRVRLLTGVESVKSSNGKETVKAEFRFGEGVFRFIPRDIMQKRAVLIS